MNKLTVSTSPHIQTKVTTSRIMADVIIALSLPAIASVVLYGLPALLIIVTCVGSAIISELLFNLATKRQQTVGDLSAAVTGLILALSLPADVKVWQCVVGSAFAIVVVKCLFGGLGHNFANPAATGRIFLFLAFAEAGGGVSTRFMNEAELVTSATPLELLKTSTFEGLPSLLDMFLGNRAGAIGEGCILAILIGFVWLVARRVIKWETPVIYVGTVFLLSLIVKGDLEFAIYQVMAGGLVYAAVFMATDYVTTPINRAGRAVFALGCGVITVLIRLFGSYPGGVSFAILIMNILSPYIERLCRRRPLGGVKNDKK
ncbi:MAG: RnfABCDGE type electron transport complex subunit D [Clostridia bacterium]|nr:RnfABCDGE type electron transport complex subunit D [Clostridia bacterium]